MDEKFPLALAAGTNVNGYVVNKVIGQGGFGITYLAFDTQANREVALKEYLPSSVALRNDAGTVTPYSVSGESDFAQGKGSFLKEAQNLGRFKHESIVQVLGYFEANGTAYTVMEFVKGDTLAYRIKQLKSEGKTMPEDEIMKWFGSVMDGLECVHGEQFLHRDIKPENIIINPDTGKGCLIDFGAARHDAGGKTKSLSVVLTPGFAPIEQYSSDGKGQGTWTDVYALGATVWCAMAGEAPKDAPGRSTEIMYQHPDPVVVDRDKLIVAGYSQKLVDTVIRMMEVNSQDRVRAISDVKNMLRCGVAPQPEFSKTVMASGASPVFPTQPTVNAGNQSNEVKVNYPNSNGSNKNIFIAVAILLVLVLGGWYCYKSGTFQSSDALYQEAVKYYQNKDYAHAVEYYQKAAEKGDARAQCELGCCYENGEGVEKNMTKAFELHKQAAQAGNAKAQQRLAYFYYNGWVVSKDVKTAVKYFEQAADNGDPVASLFLGVGYYSGEFEGVKQNYELAVKYLELPAERDVEIAQSYLAQCYFFGNGVSKNYSKAVELSQKPAENGDVPAQYILGSCYFSGDGVNQDYAQAAKWLEKAALAGLAMAQAKLGTLYELGWGVSKNMDTAVRWYTKAADQNDPDGLYALSGYYYNSGISEYLNIAIDLYVRAAKAGHSTAKEYFENNSDQVWAGNLWFGD